MEKVKNCVSAFVPGLPRPDLVQLAIFLGFFTLMSFALMGNWLGIAYLINNGAILLICFFTIALPPNTRIYYLFSIALPISAFIDILSICFNWGLNIDGTPGFSFFFSFLMELVLLIVKVLVALYEFEIAKTLNCEESPVKVCEMCKSFLNAITLQQTPIQNKQPQGVDLEAPRDDQEKIEISVEPRVETTQNEISPPEEQNKSNSLQSNQRSIRAPSKSPLKE